LVLLLMNYPVSKILMVKRTKLEQYAYVSVENNTEQDNIAVNIYPYFSAKDEILLLNKEDEKFSNFKIPYSLDFPHIIEKLTKRYAEDRITLAELSNDIEFVFDQMEKTDLDLVFCNS